MIRNSLRTRLLICFLILTSILFAAHNSIAQTDQARKPKRSDYVSDASFVVATYAPPNRDHSPEAIVSATEAFLKSLSEDDRKLAKHDLKSPERLEWTNLPAKEDAGGIRLGNLKSEQIEKACDLMACLFSEQGYNKVRDIMIADDQLLNNGKPRTGFGTEYFSIVIFGTPSTKDPWAFQVDGHHVGVNIAINGDKMTMAPSFIGTQPHTFMVAGTELTPFKNETGMAHQLIQSLTDEQAKRAVLGPTRARIKTGVGKNDNIPKSKKGVSCSTFTDDQKKILTELISQWVNDLPEPQAAKRMKQIESEFDQMKFSWNGNREPKSDVSWKIQSPSLVIEYACQNLGGNPLDHLHSVYRDPTNDYGGQLK